MGENITSFTFSGGGGDKTVKHNVTGGELNVDELHVVKPYHTSTPNDITRGQNWFPSYLLFQTRMVVVSGSGGGGNIVERCSLNINLLSSPWLCFLYCFFCLFFHCRCEISVSIYIDVFLFFRSCIGCFSLFINAMALLLC